jgi:multiple sugar transport system substrate-binding protein
MKPVKRALGAAVATLILLPISAQTQPMAARAAAACATTSTLNVTGWEASPQEITLTKKGLAGFAKLNPCIQTFYSVIPTDYDIKMQSRFASKDEPDVFYMDDAMAATYPKAGLILNLDKYLAADKVNTANYIPALLKHFQYQGHQYGLPKDWNTLAIFYNKDIFKAKGIPFPSNNLTYDQYKALAKELYTPNSNPSKVIYGTEMPDDLGRFSNFIYGFGSQIFDPITKKVLFNNAKAVQALDYYTSFQLQDHDAVAAIGTAWQGDSFGQGRVAMVLEGGWLNPTMTGTYSKVNYGVAQMPIGPAGRAADVFTNAWAASARTQYPAAAAKLIEYLTGQQYQDQQLHAGFALPTLLSVAKDPYLKAHPEVANIFASYPGGTSYNFGAQQSVVNTALNNAISYVLLGKKTPQQAISDAAKAVQSQITAIP